MQTLRRTVAILTLAAIAWLGAACERADTPTEAPPRPVATVGGPTCNVPSEYGTIQAAVNDPGCSTIIVAAGLYPEQVEINRDNVTLLGAKAGVDARTRTLPALATVESIIDDDCRPVQITTANNVVLDGFTVQGANLNPSAFPMCLGTGIWTNPGAFGKQGGYQILNNIVQNNIIGIIPASGSACPATLLQFNLIQNNNFPGPAGGTGIYTDFGLCNATIDRNKFSGHPNVSVNLAGAAGTQFDIAITNNELVGGTSESIALSNTTMSSITGNVSIGSTSSGTIDLYGGNSNVTIDNNTLFNGLRGILVEDPFSIGANSNISGHFNCIQGNSIAGMQVDLLAYPVTPQLNAEDNWWGHASGPREVPRHTTGMGDLIIDPDQNVDFDPWLNSCPGGRAPSMVTGGGQVSVNATGGKGSFGFSAKQSTQSGHLDYMNHATRAHLNCTVNSVTIISASMVHLAGTCTTNSDAGSFEADVEDSGKPGKNNTDKFKITYTDRLFATHVNEGGPGPIISGNIEIH
jgi:hypothetical protein